ncbi:MAG: LamG-like jellyroll fold domain-containing protein, partial [Bacteroidota bacterium]
MKNFISIIALIWCISLCPLTVLSQVNCADGSVNTGETYSGQVFFNYGAVNNAFSTKNRTTLTIGEPLAGVFAGQQYNGMMGFYGRFLLPPFPPTVVASQGELLDRIQVTWTIDPLSPDANQGFNVYRDNIFLSSVGKNVRSYNDFNVIAGRPYVYRISGINEFGEGTGGEAIGFQTPNGVVTGKVETKNHQAVADALVTLTPLQGFSAAFATSKGAFYDLPAPATNMMPGSGGSWTITFWVQTNTATNNGCIVKLGSSNLYFRALNSNSGSDGVEISTTATGAAFLSSTFPADTRNGWHHIALSYNPDGGQGRLYLDGALVDIKTMSALSAITHMDIGGLTGQGTWEGKLDELRIYHTLLEDVDLSEIMMSTASSQTPGLAYYWKFDEEQGESSFDIINRQKLHFCGAEFSSDRPNVKTAARTNENGYYRIEGVSYGTGTTFLTTPSKDFYANRSLRFHRADLDYVSLPDFSLTPKSTIELWLNSSGPNGTQTLLSKKWGSNEFRLNVVQNGNNNDVVCYLNGNQFNFGTLGVGYQLLSLTIDSSGTNRTVSLYKNGTLSDTHTFTGVTGNWSEAAQPWILGGRFNGSTLTDAYGGFIDEVAVYDTTLSQTSIQSHYDDVRVSPEAGLVVYFPMNEGNGNRISSNGSLLLPHGTTYGTEWSSFASSQQTTPHDFSPDTRQVTLNPSVTSVDLVDFVDLSTIPVSGYVRYKNTDCFAKNVEILVNGASFSPKIFTDSTGRFVVELN